MRQNILLVDDEEPVLDALSKALRAAGFSVRLARDGQAALEEIRRHAPDVVVSDVIMPSLNGFQMCRQLKQNPETREVPVLLMSTKTDPADQFWAAQVGALALVHKPVENRRLVEQITAILANP